MHDRKRRDILLRLPVGDLTAWHLVVTCSACRQDRYVKVQSLADRFGTEATLLALLPRFRCRIRACRQPAARVRLRNRYPAEAGGGPFHDVQLTPPVGY